MAPPTITVRVDNDLFGGRDQDQGYSNGMMVTAMSPNLIDYKDDPCLPRIAQRLNRYLDWLQPEGFEQLNMVVSFGQLLFTPDDKEPTHLIEHDRPYAAALLASIGYNARRGNDLRTTHL
ncbi:DUF2219 family protein, partial [Pseudomonas helleri]|nr:DUF2219 family protein [Pseudomonas helleri]